MGQGMVLSVPRHPHWAIQLAGIDGKLASIDGKVAGIDGKLASIDGKVAGIDGKLASCAPSTETVRRLGSTRIGRSPFKPETWGPRTRHMRSSVRRPRLPCSTPYETWSGDRAAVKKRGVDRLLRPRRRAAPRSVPDAVGAPQRMARSDRTRRRRTARGARVSTRRRPARSEPARRSESRDEAWAKGKVLGDARAGCYLCRESCRALSSPAHDVQRSPKAGGHPCGGRVSYARRCTVPPAALERSRYAIVVCGRRKSWQHSTASGAIHTVVSREWSRTRVALRVRAVPMRWTRGRSTGPVRQRPNHQKARREGWDVPSVPAGRGTVRGRI